MRSGMQERSGGAKYVLEIEAFASKFGTRGGKSWVFDTGKDEYRRLLDTNTRPLDAFASGRDTKATEAMFGTDKLIHAIHLGALSSTTDTNRLLIDIMPYILQSAVSSRTYKLMPSMGFTDVQLTFVRYTDTTFLNPLTTSSQDPKSNFVPVNSRLAGQGHQAPTSVTRTKVHLGPPHDSKFVHELAKRMVDVDNQYVQAASRFPGLGAVVDQRQPGGSHEAQRAQPVVVASGLLLEHSERGDLLEDFHRVCGCPSVAFAAAGPNVIYRTLAFVACPTREEAEDARLLGEVAYTIDLPTERADSPVEEVGLLAVGPPSSLTGLPQLPKATRKRCPPSKIDPTQPLMFQPVAKVAVGVKCTKLDQFANSLMWKVNSFSCLFLPTPNNTYNWPALVATNKIVLGHNPTRLRFTRISLKMPEKNAAEIDTILPATGHQPATTIASASLSEASVLISPIIRQRDSNYRLSFGPDIVRNSFLKTTAITTSFPNYLGCSNNAPEDSFHGLRPPSIT
ncbi:hypothetical protein M407DRAFT_9280 [Tulasnella calospora MUT 4182]|uniref:Uncharacterized protein n=1 Tax=Tulasnella calospora MUT 4182 TaxID=1051891 RepID=A0A0C3QF15_9AGAM|nr:hypothetical protein M407DRAFT_9280 [Tulasnella calospora MUT 4182]